MIRCSRRVRVDWLSATRPAAASIAGRSPQASNERAAQMTTYRPLTNGLTGAHDRTAGSETAARARALKVYPHLGHAQHGTLIPTASKAPTTHGWSSSVSSRKLVCISKSASVIFLIAMRTLSKRQYAILATASVARVTASARSACCLATSISWQVASSGCSIADARAANAAAAAATAAFAAAHSVRACDAYHSAREAAPPRSPRVFTNLPAATARQK
eukprot:scaffold46673_cov40-Phaeocystis_antarctica.AAC.1